MVVSQRTSQKPLFIKPKDLIRVPASVPRDVVGRNKS